jgi:hypothetical protein
LIWLFRLLTFVFPIILEITTTILLSLVDLVDNVFLRKQYISRTTVNVFENIKKLFLQHVWPIRTSFQRRSIIWTIISTNTQLLKITLNTDNVSSKSKSQTITTNYYSQNHPTQYSNYYYEKEHRLFKSEERFLVPRYYWNIVESGVKHYYLNPNLCLFYCVCIWVFLFVGYLFLYCFELLELLNVSRELFTQW